MHPVMREIGEQIELVEPARLDARRVEVPASVSGLITAVECGLGASVKRGSVLFDVDRRSYQIALAKAEAVVRRAQARVKRSQSERAPATGRESGAAASNPALQSVPAEEAVAELMAAEADRDLARLKLDSTRGLAPLDGIVTRVHRQPGECVKADEAVLTITALDPLYANFFVDEDTGSFLKRVLKSAQSKGAGRGNWRCSLACTVSRISRTAARWILSTPSSSRSAKRQSAAEP